VTGVQKAQAETDAKSDARKFALLLLLALETQNAASVQQVHFDVRRRIFFVDGKAISAVSVRQMLDRIESQYAKRIVKITRDLESGQIDISEWKRSFDRLITTSHVLKAAFILGGIAVAVRNNTVVERIDQQLNFADKFTDDIRTRNAGGFGRILGRAKSYLASPHLLYSDLQLEIMKNFFDEARNILRPAEHCFRKPLDPPDLARDAPCRSEKDLRGFCFFRTN
jgi:hypothetical protein